MAYPVSFAPPIPEQKEKGTAERAEQETGGVGCLQGSNGSSGTHLCLAE